MTALGASRLFGRRLSSAHRSPAHSPLNSQLTERQHGYRLDDASEVLVCNRAAVSAALLSMHPDGYIHDEVGGMLCYASAELRDDEGIVCDALQSDFQAMMYASERLKVMIVVVVVAAAAAAVVVAAAAAAAAVLVMVVVVVLVVVAMGVIAFLTTRPPATRNPPLTAHRPPPTTRHYYTRSERQRLLLELHSLEHTVRHPVLQRGA